MGHPSHSYGTSLATLDHTGPTCHLTQVNAPRLMMQLYGQNTVAYFSWPPCGHDDDNDDDDVYDHAFIRPERIYTGWSKKVNPKCSKHNFIKYWPILIFFSLL